MSETQTNTPAPHNAIERATQNLQGKMAAFNQANPGGGDPPAPQVIPAPTAGDTAAATAKAIIEAAQGKPPPAPPPPPAEAAPPAPDAAARAERLAAQEKRLSDLRARAQQKREEDTRARAHEQQTRETEARVKELADREAKLKEKEESWRRVGTDPLQGFAALGIHPETALDQIAKTVSGRNQKVELTTAQWEALQTKLTELEGKKPEIAPEYIKQLEEVQEKLRRSEEANQQAQYRELRAQKEQEFVSTVKESAPELLVEYGEKLLIYLGDQLADQWSAQGITGWKFNDLAQELKNQHDGFEQAKAERRAQLQPAARSPQSAASAAPPATSATPERAARTAATQTLTNDLSSSNGAASETNLTRRERERRATERLQARMNQRR